VDTRYIRNISFSDFPYFQRLLDVQDLFSFVDKEKGKDKDSSKEKQDVNLTPMKPDFMEWY